jgi:hypothetical protein
MMNWKGFGRKPSWPNFKALFRHLPVGTEDNHEYISSVKSVTKKARKEFVEVQIVEVQLTGSGSSSWNINLNRIAFIL